MKPFAISTAALIVILTSFLTQGAHSSSTLGAPVVAQGTLQEPDKILGIEAAAQVVEFSGTPKERIVSTPVEVQTNQSGRAYQVRLDPDSVDTALLTPDGVLDLELRISTVKGMWVTFASARMVKTEQGLTWADPIDSAAPDRSARAVLEGKAALAGTVTSPREAMVTIPSNSLAPLPAIKSSGHTASGWCDYKYKGDSNRSTTIATSYPLGKSTSWLDVSYSRGGKFGLAFKGDKGGFHASGTRSVDGGWGAT